MKKILGILFAAILVFGMLPGSTSAQTYTFNSWGELETFLAQYNIKLKDIFSGYYQDRQEEQQKEQAPAPEQETSKPAPAPAPEQETSKPAPEKEASEPAPAPAQPAPQPEEKQPAEETQSTSLSQFEQKVVELTNAERAKAGLAPLKVSEELSKVARAKSADMRDNNYFSHQSPTYGSPFDMMKQFGISYTAAGENIAAGQRTPEEVVNSWMNSAGHRKNIMSSDFTHIGVGYVSGGSYGHYWTQQFIR